MAEPNIARLTERVDNLIGQVEKLLPLGEVQAVHTEQIKVVGTDIGKVHKFACDINSRLWGLIISLLGRG
jgi:hypothetical protein